MHKTGLTAGPTTIASGGTLTNSGSHNLSASSITIASGGTLTSIGSNNLSVSGDWTNNGGTFNQNTGSVTLNGTTQSIGGSAGTTFNNLTLSNSGLKTFSTTPAVNGILSMEGTATASVAPMRWFCYSSIQRKWSTDNRT